MAASGNCWRNYRFRQLKAMANTAHTLVTPRSKQANHHLLNCLPLSIMIAPNKSMRDNSVLNA